MDDRENFDEESPFLADVKIDAECGSKHEKPAEELKEIQASYEIFQSQTKADFEEFLKELKVEVFDGGNKVVFRILNFIFRLRVSI